uniref:Cytochrome P450 n=1 Tax=Kalanchoe fedtschenkoi TaxID=63787 RepID=A0A7N0UZA6_KALFE
MVTWSTSCDPFGLACRLVLALTSRIEPHASKVSFAVKAMEFIYAFVWTVSASLMLISVAVILFVGKIFIGKSANSPAYPPVKGTVFHQILYVNRLYDHQTELARTCPTYRLLAPYESAVFTADIRNIEHVLKTRFDKYSKGRFNLEALADLFGKGIFLADGEQWRHQRKISSYEFSTRVLRDFSCRVFRSGAGKLARAVSSAAKLHQSLDIQDLLMRCTLDSIFKVGFGVDLNCLEGSNADGVAFSTAFDELNALVFWRYVDPIWKLKRFFNLGSEALIKKHKKVIEDFVYEVIRSKKEHIKQQHEHDSIEKDDILSRFLVESKKDPDNMNDDYLKDIILNFMIAGKDTSAATLSCFIYMLCKNPLVQEKVLQEIRDTMDSEYNEQHDVESFVAEISDSAIEKMHYLHAALTETLRLYPAVPMNGRCAEEDDTLPDGYRLRKGDGVYYLSYAMGRMPYISGDNAEDFRPERWIENGVFQHQPPFKFIAFHAGPRICLGKDFAFRQMKIISVALLWFFRFKLVDDNKSVTYKTMFTLHIDGGLHVHPVR